LSFVRQRFSLTSKLKFRDIFGGMQTQRRHTGANCATTRSAVSNRSRLLQNVDHRSSSARRFRDLVNAFEAEIGSNLTEVERGLVKQAAALTIRAEQLQADIVNGKDVDSDALIRTSSTAKRILGAIGEKAARRKPSEQTLEDYLHQRAAAQEAEGA
jgi:hypothetical protein